MPIVWNPHAIREVCDVLLVPEGARSPSEGGTTLGDTVTDYAISIAGSTLTNVACVRYPCEEKVHSAVVAQVELLQKANCYEPMSNNGCVDRCYAG
eukprot:scaffold396_cov352-Pavlova_lutheri.AAC.6